MFVVANYSAQKLNFDFSLFDVWWSNEYVHITEWQPFLCMPKYRDARDDKQPKVTYWKAYLHFTYLSAKHGRSEAFR